MARALAVARAKQMNNPNWKAISDSRAGRDSTQKEMAIELCHKAGVDTTKAAGITEADKF